ncbi:hypothetical protein [Planctomycetes bacterium K23_9]|uniref:Uncharacterized protein n=1 Tax=Stieleria marina TaxID=1930275 RepID=A0A517NW01_9BACT|nr:hypothetical protein K239x_33020 [Planctomycetes bacterium K23_9]
MCKTIASLKFWICTLACAGAIFTTSTLEAYVSSDPNGSGTDYFSANVLLNGNVPYDWYLSPNWGGQGNLVLWASGLPITGTYYDVGIYRVVELDQFGAWFVYYVEIDPNTQAPSAVLLHFSDSFGNFVVPGQNVLTEAL